MGIDAVYAATKRGDFGEPGILTTIDYLKRGGMHYAGFGAASPSGTAGFWKPKKRRASLLIALADWARAK